MQFGQFRFLRKPDGRGRWWAVGCLVTSIPSPLRMPMSPLLLLLSAWPSAAALAEDPGVLFEGVVAILERSYYDRGFREDVLPGLAAELRPERWAGVTAARERALVDEFLGRIPVSHLALYSEPAYEILAREIEGRRTPTFGLQLVRRGDAWFADWIFEGGPADEAGLERGDVVLEIDGVAPGRSVRLDWSTDDAALPDPPIHGLLCEEGEELELLVCRRNDPARRLRVVAAPYSGIDAARASVRIYRCAGRRFGYLHLWFIPIAGGSALLSQLIEGPFADCDGMLLDLRGRGGSASEARRLTELLDARDGRWRRPLVVLTDRGTRSAKEVITFGLRSSGSALVVGERTAGAVIPASFRRVAGAVLMFPAFTLGDMTRQLEGRGVEPDVRVADPGHGRGSGDPIVRAGLGALALWCEDARVPGT